MAFARDRVMTRFDHVVCGDLDQALRREWLETNGIGGFASSTIVGLDTRRYHGLLTAALHPPGDRYLLLAKLEETLVVGTSRHELSANQYPGTIHPTGFTLQREFRLDPFPTFTWAVDGFLLEKAVLLVHGKNTVVVTYALRREDGAPLAPDKVVGLEVRPLIAFRDFHATTHENDGIDRNVTVGDGVASMTPYRGLPTLHVAHDARRVDPSGDWYRSFEYAVERARGLDFREDLYQPFTLHFDVGAAGRATIVAGTEPRRAADADALVRAERERRAALLADVPQGDLLQRTLVAAADQYVVRRGAGKSVIAGYPWFGDWGRDTFISVRGLCLATGRLDVAREILLAWTDVVSEGMLPNRFADHGEQPEYNSVDAALWFVVAARELLDAAAASGRPLPVAEVEAVWRAIEAILEGYERGTRHRIGLDASDALLFAGEPGVQLTWMDAKVGDWVVTPRVGKPVEIQALWLAALHAAGARSDRWAPLFARGRDSFARRFWNASASCLYDVVDPDGHAGAADASFRPNQILAVGGLPLQLLGGERARAVVDGVESRLWTPLGLRSLAPGEPGYVATYRGGPRERDASYHQGTVWPWLLGPFVEAWVRVRGGTPEARQEARARFLSPLEAHLADAGIGHVSEIADAEAPHEPAGCPFQAWSVAEALRLVAQVLS
ncbi:MAG: amylo-alpha-1,6-glucosidase [Candidatus Binatia bacterium]